MERIWFPAEEGSRCGIVVEGKSEEINVWIAAGVVEKSGSREYYGFVRIGGVLKSTIKPVASINK